jgi:hypothetical protein
MGGLQLDGAISPADARIKLTEARKMPEQGKGPTPALS